MLDMPEPLLHVSGLSRRSPTSDRLILDDVEISIHVGERLALSGPSGSGKSSLLRCLAVMDRCESGIVRFRGRDVAEDDVPPFRRKVVYLPQRPSLFPVSVRDNLQIPFRLQSTNSNYDESRAVKMFEQLGRSGDLLKQGAETLSGGEQQMVSLVRALLLDPVVLLFDEPTASLDPESSRRLEDAVLTWHAGETDSSSDDRTFVWTSHDPEQLNRMTDRVLTMERGRLQGARYQQGGDS